MNIDNILSKYLSNSATEEEKRNLLRWLEENDENRRQFKKVYDLWLHTDAMLIEDSELETALTLLRKRTSSRQKNKVSFYSYRLRVIQIAASLLLLFLAGYIGYTLKDFDGSQPVAMNHLLTGPDGKGEYILPDGSTVWLNANSVLKYPDVFLGEKRIVYLEGEALFEIKEDRKHPFFVKADGLDVEVTGTRFLAKNYPRKNVVEAVLVNGIVKISGGYFADTHILHPGQLLIYNKETKQTDLSQVNTDDYTNWIHSKLVFDKTNLENVIINLEKWFGVEIVATPELIRKTHMSFTIRRESLEEVLKYMSLTAPVAYKWEGDVLHLYPKK